MVRWPQRTSEQRADALVHLLGMAAATVGILALLFTRPHGTTSRTMLALAVYAAGLLAMLGCSMAYNLAPPGPRREWLRRFDHAAIFVMIAGTYTPLMLIPLGGTWSLGLLAAVWVVALAGVATKLSAPRRFERASIAAYLALGWAALIVIGPLLGKLPLPDLLLVAAGGVLYSLGVLMHLATGIRYHNAFWHGCVVSAAGCHFVVVFRLAGMAGA